MLTCQLEAMCSRVAGSLCAAVGCPEMIAPDMNEYERRAIYFANDRHAYLALRRKLWANRLTTPLFNTRQWTREWEDALTAVWQRHSEGLAPDHIDLPQLTESGRRESEHIMLGHTMPCHAML